MARALRSLFAAAAVVAVAGLSAEAPPRVMLTKNIKTPDPIPRAGIEAATRAMESGRLYRYNVDAAEDSELSVCEQQIADYTVRSLATRDARALSGSLLARARSLTRAPSLSLSSVARARARARQGHKYALGLNSCGSALFLALLCAGVQPNDKARSRVRLRARRRCP